MKYLVVLSILIISCSSFAKSRFGLGLMLGSPTGISAKLLRRSKNPIDAALSFGRDFEIHSTYLFPQRQRVELDSVRLRWYWGLGGKIKNVDHENKNDELYIGPRASVGLNHYFKKHSLEAFSEAALNIFIAPETGTDIDLSIGLRYYF